MIRGTAWVLYASTHTRWQLPRPGTRRAGTEQETVVRKVLGVLTALVVTGSLISASIADENADVARVEQELRMIAEAVAIHNRVWARAKRAVEMSSLGREARRVEREWQKFERREEISEPASQLREKRIFHREKIRKLVRRMTQILMPAGVMRELKELR